MDYKKIENLKLALLHLTRQQCRLKVPAYGIDGRMIGVGFRPYWTGPLDSKIEKLEINVAEDNGKIVPFYLHNVLNYEVISNDGRGYDSMKNACLDIHIYSQDQAGEGDSGHKIRLEITGEEK